MKVSPSHDAKDRDCANRHSSALQSLLSCSCSTSGGNISLQVMDERGRMNDNAFSVSGMNRWDVCFSQFRVRLMHLVCFDSMLPTGARSCGRYDEGNGPLQREALTCHVHSSMLSFR